MLPTLHLLLIIIHMGCADRLRYRVSPVPTFPNDQSLRTVDFGSPNLKYMNECLCLVLREQHCLILLLSERNAFDAHEHGG